MSRPICRTAAFVFALLAAAALAAPTKPLALPSKQWTITQLPGLGGVGAEAMALNDRGDIVGQSFVFDPSTSNWHPRVTRWINGVPEDLGAGQAWDVNDHGTIAGSVFPTLESLWRDGAWRGLGVGTPGFPLFVNKSDMVASSFPFIGGPQHAYTFRDGVLADLGTLGGTESQSFALNDRGEVVGFARTAGNSAIHPFLHDGASMKDLGTMGRAQGKAVDINNHGIVVGYVSDLFDGFPVAFVHDGTMRPLIQGGACCTVPSGINDRGDVIGAIDGAGAFLLEDGELTRLDQLPAVRAAGWTQLLPTDINNRGWIVGRGLMNKPLAPGEWPFKAFVLKPNQGRPAGPVP